MERNTFGSKPEKDVDPLVEEVAAGIITELPSRDADLSVNVIKEVVKGALVAARAADVDALDVLERVGELAPSIDTVAQQARLRRAQILAPQLGMSLVESARPHLSPSQKRRKEAREMLIRQRLLRR